MQLDTTAWSGDGDLTQVLIETLQKFDEVAFVRVEDAPASRADAGYSFISNEIYVAFVARERRVPVRRFGILPSHRTIVEKGLTIEGLSAKFERVEPVGAPDYGDSGMLQYLRAQRLVAPYQTKGIKVVELVRIYEVGTERRELTP